MPQQTINIGAAPDDGTGDTLRVGGDKINDNFTELYAADAALGTAAPLDVDPDDTLAADSDSLIPTQQAVKAYVDANVGGSVAELDDVGDVNAPTPANGDVLTWDSTPGEWVSAAPTGGSNALDDLTDVDAPTPADGDVLTFDSGSGDWVPAAPTGGGGQLGPSWTDLTFGSSSSTYGQTVYVSNESFAMATGKRLEVEAYVYKVIDTDSGVWIGNSTNGVNARSQSNNVLNLYRRSSSTDTSLGFISGNTQYDYTGPQLITFSININAASSTFLRGILDVIGLVSNAVVTAFDLNGVTVTVALQTGDITKCYARARLIG